MNRTAILQFSLLSVLILQTAAANAEAPVSPATQECLDCHATFHPGIVADWQKSRHAATTPEESLTATGLARKVSSVNVPEILKGFAVGCAECHTQRADAHADTFDHNGHQVHVVVSPRDCATCHAEEEAQYGQNLMSHAHGNLTGNALYGQLQSAIIGSSAFREGKLALAPAAPETQEVSCLYCHGTRLSFQGLEIRDTDAGELEFPRIAGWPNQGVGRVNLDGSRGSCSACHTRHGFSIAVARQPYTCKECHSGPDVPAFKVYAASKHGNLFSSVKEKWDFTPVPWTIGQDFSAPTCAACHVSLLVNADGTQVAARTHRMNDRLSWRIFGLPYAHPHPAAPDITPIRNRSGLPLPTNLDGTPAAGFLIDEKEAGERAHRLQAVCLSCHDTSWVQGHWQRHEHAIRVTNAETGTLTRIMEEIWRRGLARGLAAGESPFDEFPERIWSDGWLFYANHVRFAAAMAGGGDYAVFADGRYHLSRRIAELADWLAARSPAPPPVQTPANGPVSPWPVGKTSAP